MGKPLSHTTPPSGIVTQLVASKRKPERINVFVDGEFAIQVHIDIIAKHRIAKGMQINEDLHALLRADKNSMYVRQLALAFVTYKPRTIRQLRERLRRKDFGENEIDEAVEFCLEFGYLNDAEFARMYVRDALTMRQLSPGRLRADLKKKGVDVEYIDNALREYYTNDDINTVARRAAEKKLRAVAYRPVDKQRSAVQSYLQRQGFSWSIIAPIISDLFTSPSDHQSDEY
jgi:regulatory protein